MSTDQAPAPAPEPAPEPAPDMPIALLTARLREMLDLAERGRAAPPQGQFYAVVVPEVGHARCHQFATIEEMVAKLREVYATKDRYQIFAFIGTRLAFSNRGDYLFAPWGGIFALFATAEAEAADDDYGFMGEPTAPPPAPAEVSDGEGDGEGEEDAD
jgi:hypothetical protein